MNLEKAIEGFLIAKAADGYSPNTIDRYQWGLTILLFYVKNANVHEITKKDLQAFMVWVQSEYQPHRPNDDTTPLAPASRENIWIAIRSFFNWAEVELKLDSRPDNRLARPRYQSKVIQPFNEEEIKALIKAAQFTRTAHPTNRRSFVMKRSTSVRDPAIMLCLLDTGLRVSELTRLNIRCGFPRT